MYISADYLYEPFSTKTFNFPEEDQALDQLERRLVQSTHVLGADIKWKTKWKKWARTSLRFHADAWWPAFRRDRRWATRLYPNVRFGELEGVFGEIEGQLFYKKFPNYVVADRTIDQQGWEVSGSLGYNFEKIARLSAGFDFGYTDYLNSRYDTQSADGMIGRSDTSKNYLIYSPWAAARLQPGHDLELSAKYTYQIQDAQFYDREMNGRGVSGLIEPKFIPSYYDFRRSSVSVRGEWDYADRLHLELMSEVWVRRFNNYEARGVDNVWTGELRLDTSLEVGGEASVRLVSFDWLQMQHDLHFTVFASHLRRTSNMKREVSLSTNFELTRVFAGLEFSGR